MSTRTSHRRAAGKKIRQEKYLRGEKSLPAEKAMPVRNPDKNRDLDDQKIITAFAACDECFTYSLTVHGLCWACTRGGAS